MVRIFEVICARETMPAGTIENKTLMSVMLQMLDVLQKPGKEE